MLEIAFQKKGGDTTTNFILAADSYKVGQEAQSPQGDTKGHSNIVPRKAYTTKGGIVIDRVTVLGPQIVAFILSKVVITDAMIDEAEVEITEYGYDFPRENWERIRDYGFLPLVVKALPEGSIVPIGLPIMTIENTDDFSRWLVSYVETWSQDICWQATTVASKLRILRGQCEQFAEATGVPIDGLEVEYMVHNFGDRGAGDGGQGGIIPAIAHALYFSGSDCLRANRYIKKFYNTIQSYLSSLDAAEHSTICANSRLAEKDDYSAFKMGLDMLRRAVDRSSRGIGIPVISQPIDTYDDERFVKDFIVNGYDEICAIGGKYVARPDSGNAITKPIEVALWLIEGLLDKGVAPGLTDDGYRMLPPNLGVIQGDGLREDDFKKIFDLAIDNNLAASNFVTGYGGGMTNGSGRDDFSFSMKATARKDASGEWIEMQKLPKSDLSKASLCGRVTVFKDMTGFLFAGNVALHEVGPGLVDMMNEIYRDGEAVLLSFDEVRANARS